ncbi:hypothetical protein JBW_00305 [Pelosinus fermentans JBW45]|uniref:Uncharacterized protein n=1 Tax=Pelosinus fermentans JBW45 TaxID=1192197 RepID=I9NJU0_9FIRM|nr:hypothetical protein JBW_00305 [Pelosinus fermentans JBW45]
MILVMRNENTSKIMLEGKGGFGLVPTAATY